MTAALDRATLRTVQYPRGFAADQLSRLLAGRTSDDFDELDESLRLLDEYAALVNQYRELTN